MSFNIIQEAKTKALKSIDFPADSDKAAKDLVIVFEGEMFIKKDGDYTFTLDSNAGGHLNITDMATGASLELFNAEEGVSTGSITLKEGE